MASSILAGGLPVVKTEKEIDSAISKAADELLGGSEGETQVTEGEETPESEESETSESEETPQDELDEAALDEAKRLYKALKDPKAGPAVIAALAQQTGLLNPQSNKTEKQVEKNTVTIQQIIKEALGKEYEFLADRLGNGIEKILEGQRAENDQKFNQIEQNKIASEVSTVMTAVARENKISVEQLTRLTSPLMEQFLPGPNTSVNDYIRGLYKQATVGQTASKVKSQTVDKINRNAKDGATRLSQTGTGAPIQLPTGKLGLKGSVEYALKQLENAGATMNSKGKK